MTQNDKILKIMLDNPEKEIWTAKDFQQGKWFIGYEASARMSEIANDYPWLVEVGKEGRFRTLKINCKNHDELAELYDILKAKENEMVNN